MTPVDLAPGVRAHFGRRGFPCVSLVLSLTLASSTVSVCARAQQAIEPRRLELPWLWVVRAPSGSLGNSDPGLRGWNDGERYRPGLGRRDDGYDDPPRVLPEGSGRDRLRVSDEFAVGPMYGRNLDAEALLRKYPNTLPDYLVGHQGRYFNRAIVEVEGVIADNRLQVAVEGIDERESRTYLGATEPEEHSRPRYTLNFTWTPDALTHLTLGGRYDAALVTNAGLSAYDLASAARRKQTVELSVVLTARRQLSPRNEVAAIYDLTRLRDDGLAASGLAVPGHINLDTYQRWGNYPMTLIQDRTRHRADLRWSTFLDGLLLDNDAHTVTVGVQLEALRSRDDETRNGGFTFVDYAATDDRGVPVRSVNENDRATWELFSSDRGDELHGRTRQLNWAAYAQDEIQLGGRFTLVPGARFEHFSGGFIDGPTVWESDTISPRVRAEWLVHERGSTRLLASAGRHYQALDPSTVLRCAEGAAYSPLEYWDWTGPQDAPPPGRSDPGWRLAQQFPALMGSMHDAKHPYADRLVLSVVQTVDAIDLEAELRYERRQYRDILAIYDATASVYDPLTNPGGSYDVRSYGDDLPGARDQTTYYDLRESAHPTFVVGNPPDAWRSYDSVALAIRLDPLRWLTLRGMGTYTYDRGSLENTAGVSTEWRDPNGRINSFGNMSGYDPWTVKLSAVGDLPGKLRATLEYYFFSGQYYSRYFRVSPTNGPRTYILDSKGRGGYQLPPRHLVDARLDWTLPVDGTGRWGTWVSVYNVLNSATVTGLREQSTVFRRVSRIERPREFHLGVRYDL